MDSATLDSLLASATDAVLAAGRQARALQPEARVLRCKEGGDLVTSGDLAAEDCALTLLRARFPDHGYYSEECGAHHPGAEYLWILDPIDGTKYYAGGIPLYAVSLGLRWRNRLVLGAVYAPEFDRLYVAAAGRGATLNGQPIACSRTEELDKATICVEIANCAASAADQRQALDRMATLVKGAFRVRIIGVASLSLCFCAAGGFDAYLSLAGPMDQVDFAGGWVVAQEAGAQVQTLGPHLLAGPPKLCASIRALLDI